jgi:hypothetical protein
MRTPAARTRADRLPADRQERIQNRQDRAQEIRKDWDDRWDNIHDEIFEPGWRLEYPNLARANYHYNWPNSEYFWAAATMAGVAAWTASEWDEEADYDYGGSVVYEGETVYVDGQAAGTTADAAAMATTQADAGAQQMAATAAAGQADQTEWMPLGVFALVNEEAGDPTRYLQLAVSKEGLISGTFYNAATDQAQPVYGALDRQTQKVAFYAGDKKDTVVEAGIYNLTQEQAPVLIHFPGGRAQEYLLVRLPEKAAGGR